MTREEIAQKIDSLSGEMFTLGRACTSQHFKEDEDKTRSILLIAAELLKNTSFALDSIYNEIKGE